MWYIYSVHGKKWLSLEHVSHHMGRNGCTWEEIKVRISLELNGNLKIKEIACLYSKYVP